MSAGPVIRVRLLVATALVLGACSSQNPAVESESGELSGSAVVFAAASLTEAFAEMAEAFEATHPQASIVFNFGSSSGLATQLVEQGGGDVFASADAVQMQKVVDAQLVRGEPRPFVRNHLQIIVPFGNPAGVEALEDLADPDLKVVLAAEQVPVGRYAQKVLSKAGVTVNPVSEAGDAKGVVGPVALGEADAGIAYATDVAAADGAEGVDIPDELNVEATYPIALTQEAAGNPVAQAFFDFVLDGEGRRIMGDFGFGAVE
ncbi:MAG: molybdate ABC transporter substrate-binding protein [Actinobacteria bacterium]|nr:molybdate ABC transporter substrate-binding protein [Actinomycetota bacterium]